jgi:3-hydroxy acid dehydrogenase/malonic semialdehyde reductase
MKEPLMIALVTGATAGFGEAIAKRFIQDGFKVVGAGRRQARLDALATELGPNFFGLELDVTDAKAIPGKLAALPPAFREIDILVNNAGLALGLGSAQTAELGDWSRMVETNVSGVLNMTHAVLPEMVKRGRGHIVNLGSIAGEFPYPGGNVYGATKAFVKQFGRNLRADLLGTPIRVSNIEPGLCGGTEFSEVRFKGDRAKADSVYAGTQPILPEDIAETISWIVRLPKHVNINAISMMPVCQAFGPLAIHRSKT